MPVMGPMTYRNASDAFLGELARVMNRGEQVTPRGERTKELIGEAFTIEYPQERFIVLPYRQNNPFAAIVESVWVLAGRNDLAFLGRYLPRATDFSDDGVTWRAGYGPRLRDWDGVDQLGEVLTELTKSPSSRRGVMSIFDPKRDFVDSKDIPCNNWLHWVIRDGLLELSIAVRSNDVMWGFSGINTFEWSILHECMAHWLGVGIGRQHWFVTSMHLYEKHWERARQILAASSGLPNLYAIPKTFTQFEIPFANLDEQLKVWFRLEDAVRSDPGGTSLSRLSECKDPLLSAFLLVLRAYWLRDSGRPAGEAMETLSDLATTDLYAVADEYLNRGTQEDRVVSVDCAQPLSQQSKENASLSPLSTYIATLHAEKDAAYRDSWKKRGEQIGVLANIARKVDRLANILEDAPVGDETVFDTAVDAFVYSLKYYTYLLDLDPTTKNEVLGDEWVRAQASDGVLAFNELLAQFRPAGDSSATPIEVSVELALLLSTAEALAQRGAPLGERIDAAKRLSEVSYVLAGLVVDPSAVGGKR